MSKSSGHFWRIEFIRRDDSSASVLAPAVLRVGDAALNGQRLKVLFLDVNLGAHVRPPPFAGQVQPGKHPRLQLFPSVFGEETYPVAKLGLYLGLNVIKPLPPSDYAIAVNAEDDYVGHAAIISDDFSDTFRLQGFSDTAQQRIPANLHVCVGRAQASEKPSKTAA